MRTRYPANPLAMLLLAAATTFAQANASGQSFTDSRDGKTYKTVKIGKQTWMAENLNYKTNDSWCNDNDEANCKKFGRQYAWETAKNACPKGWHLPSKDEWVKLAETTGKEAKNLKTTTGWNSYEGKNGNGTDEFGFSAKPGGSSNFSSDGNFYVSRIDTSGYWWTATENKDRKGRVYYLSIDIFWNGININHYEPDGSGNSVRCVADNLLATTMPERYLFEQSIKENEASLLFNVEGCSSNCLERYVPNIGFSTGKRIIYSGSISLLNSKIPETALAVLDKKELRLLRNAIFAKHGVIFQADDLKSHFQKFDWYKPQSDNVDDKLTELDKENISRIRAFENATIDLDLREMDLVGKYNNYYSEYEQTSFQITINRNGTFVYKHENDNFEGSYKIESGFLVVLVAEQYFGGWSIIRDILNDNWRWPSDVTYRDGIVIYKKPIKLVFPVGDTDFKGGRRQIGATRFWIWK